MDTTEAPRTPLFIGIGHRKQQGKTTFAHLLEEAIRHLLPQKSVAIHPFSQALKECVYTLFGVEWALLDGTVADKNTLTNVKWADLIDGGDADAPLTVRQLLQTFGTEIMRAKMPNVWVNAVMKSPANAKRDIVIVPDVRFQNEADAIERVGGLLIKVERPSYPSHDLHVSERALDYYTGWDRTVINNSTQADLRIEAYRLVAGPINFLLP